MSKIDKEKEEIGWIKFWIGVGVASIMGLPSFHLSRDCEITTSSVSNSNFLKQIL